MLPFSIALRPTGNLARLMASRIFGSAFAHVRSVLDFNSKPDLRPNVDTTRLRSSVNWNLLLLREPSQCFSTWFSHPKIFVVGASHHFDTSKI